MNTGRGLAQKSSAAVGSVARLYSPRNIRERGWVWATGLALVTYAIICVVLAFIWSREPHPFDVSDHAADMAALNAQDVVIGYTTTAALVRVASTLLDKPGGYLSNDIFPPGVVLDNIPNWEMGVLQQIRDMSRSLRNDFSRSQTQSKEDPDLKIADPQFHFPSDKWILPATEGQYRKGIEALESYLTRLADSNQQDAQFYARADNLVDWLAVVEKRLGALSQRLSASVGQVRVNVDLAGDNVATQSTQTPAEVEVQTPWHMIDDVFFEARGTTWALLQLLKAIEVDMAEVLADKNAAVSLAQIIRELEETQARIWSPIILNGKGLGFFANHSLVMASYISRANAGVIDLRSLLERG